MEVEVKGLYEIFIKQVEGYCDVVVVVGGDLIKVFQFLLIEKLFELVKIQVEVVKNIKIDKVIVWDFGNLEIGGFMVNFVLGMMKSVLLFNDFFNMVGLNFLIYLKGNDVVEELGKIDLLVGNE